MRISKYVMFEVSLLALAIRATVAGAFSPYTNNRSSLAGCHHRNVKSSSPLSMSTTEIPGDTDTLTSKGLMKRDRYVATNRFAVRRDQQAKFEKRWANRKSRLAELPGFKYFHLMRRVKLVGSEDDGDVTTVYDGGDESDEAALENYVSFTIWQKKSDFSAWRKGSAFKEAHGGTSIGAFVSTMVKSALILRGAPRPAFYDGLLVESTKPADLPEMVDGWRSVEADGINTLPPECFVCFEKFFVPLELAAGFEKNELWEGQRKSLGSTEGFVAFSLMRRDGQAKGHGMVEVDVSEPTYVATYIFKDRSSLEKWASVSQTSGDETSDFWNKTPEKNFYEGTLVISSEEGA